MRLCYARGIATAPTFFFGVKDVLVAESDSRTGKRVNVMPAPFTGRLSEKMLDSEKRFSGMIAPP